MRSEIALTKIFLYQKYLRQFLTSDLSDKEEKTYACYKMIC